MRWSALAILFATLTSSSSARVIRVPDDYPTIDSAMETAAPGDTIVVACGTYHENHISLADGVTLTSETASPDCVEVDGDQSFVIFQGYNLYGPPVRLIGMTMRGADLAIRLDQAVSVRITDCRIEAGIDAIDANLLLTRCELTGISDRGVEADYGTLVIDDCFVHHNPASGLIRLRWAALGNRMRRSVFWANGGSIGVFQSGRMEVSDCVFYANTGSLSFSGNDTVEHSAFMANSGAIGCPSFSCCDLFQNLQGDWTGCREDELGVLGNISADPLFCNADQGDFTLHSDSPCLPEHSSCPRPIGGHGVGCGVVSVTPTSWGSLKERYRSPDRQ